MLCLMVFASDIIGKTQRVFMITYRDALRFIMELAKCFQDVACVVIRCKTHLLPRTKNLPGQIIGEKPVLISILNEKISGNGRKEFCSPKRNGRSYFLQTRSPSSKLL